jgi:peptide chain release factor
MSVWLQISSGEGPAECCWVVARLAEVLTAEAEAAGLAVRTLEFVPGEETGTFKTVLLSLDGPGEADFAAGWQGTVQWVGRSPYRPQHRRKNWFVGVEPFEIPEELPCDTKDLVIETMRSSGPGGQHVNKTESMVRITHRPTGLQVIAREERSQRLNRKLALLRMSELLERNHQTALAGVKRQRWQQHHALVRGNAVRVFQGPDFRPRSA